MTISWSSIVTLMLAAIMWICYNSNSGSLNNLQLQPVFYSMISIVKMAASSTVTIEEEAVMEHYAFYKIMKPAMLADDPQWSIDATIYIIALRPCQRSWRPTMEVAIQFCTLVVHGTY
eukprot:5824292-Amphidinium_carterae.2